MDSCISPCIFQTLLYLLCPFVVLSVHMKDSFAFLENGTYCHFVKLLFISEVSLVWNLHSEILTLVPPFFWLVLAWCIFLYPFSFHLPVFIFKIFFFIQCTVTIFNMWYYCVCLSFAFRQLMIEVLINTVGLTSTTPSTVSVCCPGSFFHLPHTPCPPSPHLFLASLALLTILPGSSFYPLLGYWLHIFIFLITCFKNFFSGCPWAFHLELTHILYQVTILLWLYSYLIPNYSQLPHHISHPQGFH